MFTGADSSEPPRERVAERFDGRYSRCEIPDRSKRMPR
jgi:hypothetical protein